MPLRYGSVQSDGTVLLSKAQFHAWLCRQIEEREPVAAVRFGDSEAKLLQAEDDGSAMDVAVRKLRRETGLPLTADDVRQVRALVMFAFDQADAVGIRAEDDGSAEAIFWSETLTGLYRGRMREGRAPAALAPRVFDYGLLESLPQVLAGRRVSVVSCRDVGPALEAEWGLEDVAVYQVPSQHSARDVDGSYEAVMHDVPIWPDAHARLRVELSVRERGEVFLVGAGAFGKDLCIRVRDRGGIALDLGSALDHLAGKITRGPVRRALNLYSSGMSIAEVAARLEEFYGVPVEQGEVARRIRAYLGDGAT